MKVSVYIMRDHGVKVSKSRLPETSAHDGDLSISVTQDNRLNRISKTATLKRNPLDTSPMQLMDITVLWMNEDRFALSGFEQRKRQDSETVDYAQTWLCLLGTGSRLKTRRDLYEEAGHSR